VSGWRRGRGGHTDGIQPDIAQNAAYTGMADQIRSANRPSFREASATRSRTPWAPMIAAEALSK
jgi:hypothetical protein